MKATAQGITDNTGFPLNVLTVTKVVTYKRSGYRIAKT